MNYGKMTYLGWLACHGKCNENESGNFLSSLIWELGGFLILWPWYFACVSRHDTAHELGEGCPDGSGDNCGFYY